MVNPVSNHRSIFIHLYIQKDEQGIKIKEDPLNQKIQLQKEKINKQERTAKNTHIKNATESDKTQKSRKIRRVELRDLKSELSKGHYFIVQKGNRLVIQKEALKNEEKIHGFISSSGKILLHKKVDFLKQEELFFEDSIHSEEMNHLKKVLTENEILLLDEEHLKEIQEHLLSEKALSKEKTSELKPLIRNQNVLNKTIQSLMSKAKKKLHQIHHEKPDFIENEISTSKKHKKEASEEKKRLEHESDIKNWAKVDLRMKELKENGAKSPRLKN